VKRSVKWIAGSAVAALGALLGLSLLSKPARAGVPSKPPTNQPLALPPGWDAKRYDAFVVRALGETPRYNAQYYPSPADAAELARLYAYQRNVWNGRASAFFALYGRERDAAGLFRAGPWFRIAVPSMSGWSVASLNRYGQGPQGFKGGLDALGIIATIGNYTLPNVPGVGSAANAALQGAVALGKGQSLEDAALAAVRGSLPPWGQIAFDMAVGVAAGKDVDDVAVEAGLAALEQKYPGARQAFSDGKAAAKTAGL